MIRKGILIIAIVLALLIGCMGCQQQADTVLLLHQDGFLETYSRETGDADVPLGPHIQWESNGCRLSYDSEEKGSVTVELPAGEIVEVNMHSYPPIRWEVCLCHSGDPIPASWRERVEARERILRSQSAYGSYERYTASRDGDAEREMIRDALDAFGIGAAVDAWYDVFLRAIWYNGDLSFAIAEASAARETPHGYVVLTLTDAYGNEMALYGTSAFLNFVMFNGKEYFGPLE